MAVIPSSVWIAVRADYEAGPRSSLELGEIHGLNARTIRARARRERWVRPGLDAEGEPEFGEAGADPSAPPAGTDPDGAIPADAERRAALVTRLYLSFERQIDELGRRFGGEDAAAGEKDARTLAILARTFETLDGLRDRRARRGRTGWRSPDGSEDDGLSTPDGRAAGGGTRDDRHGDLSSAPRSGNAAADLEALRAKLAQRLADLDRDPVEARDADGDDRGALGL
jgi:hypothetical protein